jgi:hypothetical protein
MEGNVIAQTTSAISHWRFTELEPSRRLLAAIAGVAFDIDGGRRSSRHGDHSLGLSRNAEVTIVAI